jgi:hypothetical protein
MQSQCPSYSFSLINFRLHDHTFEAFNHLAIFQGLLVDFRYSYPLNHLAIFLGILADFFKSSSLEGHDERYATRGPLWRLLQMNPLLLEASRLLLGLMSPINSRGFCTSSRVDINENQLSKNCSMTKNLYFNGKIFA